MVISMTRHQHDATSSDLAAGPSVDHVWGQMTVTSEHVITPVGTFDLIGTRWSANEAWQSQRVRPGWALVAGLLTFWTVVGIAFFYVSKVVQCGQVTITMEAPDGSWWRETLPANDPLLRSQLTRDVMVLDNWSIAAQASNQPSPEQT